MEIKNVNSKVVVGKIFMASQLDENRSFAQLIQQAETDPEFQNFLSTNNVQNQRTSLIVFNPESFMLFYGAAFDEKVALPAGFNHYDLPKAEVAQELTEGVNLSYFSQPLNVTIPKFLEKVTEADIKHYENIGDSPTPYILSELNLETKKLTQSLYLKES
ncbi:hypothetical protein FP435_01965 [Lactobacillus sp. PV037]|uniref:hypothetical protein n=1 Tax=unclassified Lactobacillus TaxID=2620435 RepID=UPI0022403FC3|nr:MULTISPECIES: hypothetical protein [unclassified Lactobacillus]QNQ82599.1 hypothetical protein FP433_05850 [Lactobacillus sp. PV012]QNQ83286.1 hypothetical protein FP435_01965 [Lactobacillus sp. PV037]